jgi:hypothetical protein
MDEPLVDNRGMVRPYPDLRPMVGIKKQIRMPRQARVR